MSDVTVLASQAKRHNGEPRLPNDYLRRITDYRAKGKANQRFSYIFFYDHPQHQCPWFIAFSTITISSGPLEPVFGWGRSTPIYRRAMGMSKLNLKVLNETDDLLPPSMQYMGDWLRAPSAQSMNAILIYNFNDGHCEELELIGVFPNAYEISASANFDTINGRMASSDPITGMRTLFDITLMYREVGTYTTREYSEMPTGIRPVTKQIADETDNKSTPKFKIPPPPRRLTDV